REECMLARAGIAGGLAALLTLGAGTAPALAGSGAGAAALCTELAGSPSEPALATSGGGVAFDDLTAADAERAISACEPALELDPVSAELQFRLGRLFTAVGRDAEAVALYRSAAGQGYAPAQNNLANHIQDGRGVKQDLAGAAELFRLAAEQGLPIAQYNLGV